MPRPRRKPGDEEAFKSNLPNLVEEVKGMFSKQSAYANADAAAKLAEEARKKRRKQGY